MLSVRVAKLISFLEGLAFPRFVLRFAVRAAILMKFGACGSITSSILRRGGVDALGFETAALLGPMLTARLREDLAVPAEVLDVLLALPRI